MSFSRSVFLLFALNIVDAIVTIMWVRNGWATEGNYLMATVLDFGEAPFFAVKLCMGLITAGVLLYGSEYRLAVIGARLGLAAYSVVIVSVAGLFLGTLWARTRNLAVVVAVHAATDLIPNLVDFMRGLHILR